MKYSKEFYENLQRCRVWQEQIGKQLINHYGFKSVIDFGCGNGYYLLGAMTAGANVFGFEYSYEQCKEFIPIEIRDKIKYSDLSIPIKTEKFDVALSFEVAEHLPEKKSDIFIDNLTSSSNSVVFSAAIPGQGGVDHINEQPKPYWIEKFKNRGFSYSQPDVDIIVNMFNNLQQKRKYINVMKRNVMFFKGGKL